MLSVFSPIFAEDSKMTLIYNFVAPFTKNLVTFKR